MKTAQERFHDAVIEIALLSAGSTLLIRSHEHGSDRASTAVISWLKDSTCVRCGQEIEDRHSFFHMFWEDPWWFAAGDLVAGPDGKFDRWESTCQHTPDTVTLNRDVVHTALRSMEHHEALLEEYLDHEDQDPDWDPDQAEDFDEPPWDMDWARSILWFYFNDHILTLTPEDCLAILTLGLSIASRGSGV